MIKEKIILLPLLAGIITLAVTPFVRNLNIKLGAVDIPNYRKKHVNATPSSGGVAIIIGFFTIAIFLLLSGFNSKFIGLLIGAAFIALVGFIDDIKHLPVSSKFLAQIIAAILVVTAGVKIEFISNLSSVGIFDLGSLAIPVTILWIVAVTNAINLIDGLDGLAAGVAGISAFTMGIVFMIVGQQDLAILAFTLGAVSIAFLPYNFSNKKKIFMGDSGSYFLGFSLAVLSVMGTAKVATAFSLLVPILVLAVPILDTAHVILKRLRNKKPITEADREHLHHKLVDIAGMGQREAVFFIYTLTVILSAVAVVSAGLSAKLNVALYASFFAIILIIILAAINKHQQRKNGKV